MKAILLDGSQENDNTGERLRTALTAQLQTQGWDVEYVALCEKKIGACAGDFFCWICTPGICNVDDDNRLIAEALAASDLLVYLTPVTFGGYSSTLKLMVDHQIQNVSPFFTKVEGETHHHKRYKKNPDLLAVGWMDEPDEQSETVFRHLVQRNAINWHSKTWVSDVVLADQSDGELQASAQNWLNDLQSGHSSQRVELTINGDPSTAASTSSAQRLGAGSGEEPVELRRALLLVGSPKTRKSTSNALGGYLFEQLSARSIQTETIYLHTVLRSPAKMQALLDAVEAADLVTLAFPLYVDTLPAPVIEALERIAAHRPVRDQSHQQMFTAIANCGFPEAYQTANALAVCETFARQAGFEWAGALALGAGPMLQGKPLSQAGGMAVPICKSLDLAAEMLAQGQAISKAARDSLAIPVIPHWIYHVITWFSMRQGARHYGAEKLLKRQPYWAKAR